MTRSSFLFPFVIALFSVSGSPVGAQETRFDSEVSDLLRDPGVAEALTVIQLLEPTTIQDLIDLTEIPAHPISNGD